MTFAKHRRVGIETFLLVGTLWLVGSVLSGCTVSHQVMRGSVVAIMDSEAHICIGSEGGLKQVHSTKKAIVPDRSRGYRSKIRYERVRVGTARVIEILSEHYAAIEFMEGELLTNDIVEKSWRQ